MGSQTRLGSQNVISVLVHGICFGIPNAFGIPECNINLGTLDLFWDPTRVWNPRMQYKSWYTGSVLGSQTRLGSLNAISIVIHWICFGIPKAFGIPEQIQCIKIYSALWDPKRVWDSRMHYKSWYIGSVLQKAWW